MKNTKDTLLTYVIYGLISGIIFTPLILGPVLISKSILPFIIVICLPGVLFGMANRRIYSEYLSHQNTHKTLLIGSTISGAVAMSISFFSILKSVANEWAGIGSKGFNYHYNFMLAIAGIIGTALFLTTAKLALKEYLNQKFPVLLVGVLISLLAPILIWFNSILGIPMTIFVWQVCVGMTMYYSIKKTYTMNNVVIDTNQPDSEKQTQTSKED